MDEEKGSRRGSEPPVRLRFRVFVLNCKTEIFVVSDVTVYLRLPGFPVVVSLDLPEYFFSCTDESCWEVRWESG